MVSKDWGPCKLCKWWQIDPGAPVNDETMGVCVMGRLQLYRLRVSGDCGCNRFSVGEPVRAAGSSSIPPTTFVAPPADSERR